MKKTYQAILTSLFLLWLSLSAKATVVTFEGLELGAVPEGYAGISGWTVTGSVIGAPNETIDNQAFSGEFGEWLTFDAPVVLDGLYYKSYYEDHPFINIYLKLQDEIVGSLTGTATNQLIWYAFEYAGQIDSLYIDTGQYGYTIDNLTYTSAVSQVPLPAAGLLFTSGLALFGVSRRYAKCSS